MAYVMFCQLVVGGPPHSFPKFVGIAKDSSEFVSYTRFQRWRVSFSCKSTKAPFRYSEAQREVDSFASELVSEK